MKKYLVTWLWFTSDDNEITPYKPFIIEADPNSAPAKAEATMLYIENTINNPDDPEGPTTFAEISYDVMGEEGIQYTLTELSTLKTY